MSFQVRRLWVIILLIFSNLVFIESSSANQRHAIEVDYHLFRKELKHELQRAGVDIGKAPAGNKKLYKKLQVI